MEKPNELIIVANRAPISDFKKGAESVSVGGLTSAMHRVAMEGNATWVYATDINNFHSLAMGHTAGNSFDKLGRPARVRFTAPGMNYDLSPVIISDKEYRGYYNGYSNSLIWPLFHYFPDKCLFRDEDWNHYVSVNKKFAEHIAGLVKENPDAMIWIQDYHLFMLAKYLREEGVTNPIGFFLHIPFPTYEIFRILPQREEVLDAMLQMDIIGFHTLGYVSNFRRSVRRILPEAIADAGSLELQYQGRKIKINAFPISVDAQAVTDILAKESSQSRSAKLRESISAKYIGLGVDRLDYSKGIPQKLKAIEYFFKKKAKYRGKVSFVQIAVPSRGAVEDYQKIKEEVEVTISRINGQYGTLGWQPIIYINRSIPFQHLMSYYQVADFALITPLRDGMNLVAKEFVVARKENSSLILSELAGAAEVLTDTTLVNPYNQEQIADAIEYCLENPESQNKSLKDYREKLFDDNVHKWARGFISEIEELGTKKETIHL